MGFFNIFRNEEELGYYKDAIPKHYLGTYWERKYKDQVARVILTAIIVIIGLFFIFSLSKSAKDANSNNKLHRNPTWNEVGPSAR